ncbi:MAG: SHOCT domain-containing protein [Candidatus Methanofastidiosia archaeon]|jgi:tetratricopeptide (TPR) repeat protein
MKKKLYIFFIFVATFFLIFEIAPIQVYNTSKEKPTFLYDSYHSNAEKTNFSKFFSELSSLCTIECSYRPLTEEDLRQCDILMISTPIEAFSREEIYDIKEFVERGGGLLLMGNGWYWVDYHHKPIEDFPFNQIAQEFRVAVNSDCIVDPTNYHPSEKPHYPIFTKFASHFVTDGLTEVYTLIPSSLSIAGNVVPLVVGDEDSYSGCHEPVYIAGDYPPVVAALEYGKGRIIFISHDCFIANSEVDKYDNLKFGLNMFNWLSENLDTEKAHELAAEGYTYFNQKEYSQAKLKFDQAKEIYQNVEDNEKIAEMQSMILKCDKGLEAADLYTEGMDSYQNGDYEVGKNKFQESKSLYNELEDTAGAEHAQKMILKCDKGLEAAVFYTEGMDSYQEGEYQAGKNKFQESKSLYNELEDTAGAEHAQKMILKCDKGLEAAVFYNEGMESYQEGEYQASINKFKRAATLYQEVDNFEKATEAWNKKEEAQNARDEREKRNRMLIIGGIVSIFVVIGIMVKVLLKKPKEEEYTPSPEVEEPTKIKKPAELEVLRKRLTKGEITPEEYERLKRILEKD